MLIRKPDKMMCRTGIDRAGSAEDEEGKSRIWEKGRNTPSKYCFIRYCSGDHSEGLTESI
jgi:hypothetical protein